MRSRVTPPLHYDDTTLKRKTNLQFHVPLRPIVHKRGSRGKGGRFLAGRM